MAAKKGHKYIFVVGGVMSGVGKGIAASSIGKILQAKGFKVNPIKVDPYLNVDAGTMNPTEHGEVFVLDSGLETDQDMGNYERFMDLDLTNEDYVTSGMVYLSVIERERNLEYGGKCVEAIPHIREEVIQRIERSAEVNGSDISLIEIGGTIGDYQNIMFIEAARVLKVKHPNDVMFIMVSYLPIPSKIGEMKTRPTQHAVTQLNSYGVQPDMIIARAELPLDQKRKEKIAIACSVAPENVISAPDVESIYDVPLNFEKDEIGEKILERLGLEAKTGKADFKKWNEFVSHTKNTTGEVDIAIVGKYFDTGDFVLTDAYISVIEAIKFSAYTQGVKPNITWINAKEIQRGEFPVGDLGQYDGIIVPGGFGETGIEGKITAAEYARENKIPYFGLCYGLHMLVIEYARHVLGLKDANTTEINPETSYPVIDILPEQKEKIARKEYGGTMRLGAYPCALKKGSIVREAYGEDEVSERHRHRYEINPVYVEELEKAGLVFSGTWAKGNLKEIAELPREVHPFMVGTQFHPELKARPLSPHPLFSAFIKASIDRRKKRAKETHPFE